MTHRLPTPKCLLPCPTKVREGYQPDLGPFTTGDVQRLSHFHCPVLFCQQRKENWQSRNAPNCKTTFFSAQRAITNARWVPWWVVWLLLVSEKFFETLRLKKTVFAQNNIQATK